MSKLLFSEIAFGPVQLKNRIVMAPMTRSRAIGNIPNELLERYYAQRAGAGLIITEGTSPSPNGLGYARIPGIFNQEQARAWKKVTEQVHRAGGRIFVQLMHTGRVSHPANLPQGAEILGPSAVPLSGTMYTDSQGMQPYPLAKEMNEEQIQKTIGEFVSASRLAMEAGFDGVELHGANGYLLDQFMNAASNKRKDSWGGSILNRARFTLEVARKVGEAIGFNRLGIRLSPYGAFNGMEPDPETENFYESIAGELGKLGLLYIHIVDHSAMGAPAVPSSVKEKIRKQFGGKVILSGGYNADLAEASLLEKKGELVAFGRPFISNPSLVEKFKKGSALTSPDPSTFYTSGEKGYTDY